MSLTTETILGPARMTRGYAEVLLKGITPQQFARIPKGVSCNNPAWVYGHLANYPDRMLQMLGRADLAKPDDMFIKHFENKTTPIDDAEGTVYPDMKTITSRYFDRTDAILGALAGASDAQLSAVNPIEGMRDRLPTVGTMINFMLGAHSMMHLGQVSTWRRVMGLPSAM